MQERGFRSAREMMEAALAEADSGAQVLTPTSRLAKRYRHERRMEARAPGRELSWEPPPIYALARWLRAHYEALWETRALLPKAGQLHFWAEAYRLTPPPEELRTGVPPTPALFSRLQQTYDLLCKKLAQHSSPREGLGAWRHRLIQAFEAQALEGGYRLWHQVVETVAQAFREGRLPCPERVVLLHRDPLEPSEARFFTALEEAGCAVAAWTLGAPAERPRCTVYATPEQECRAACHAAREVWNSAADTGSYGIVVLDDTYFPRLRTYLSDLSGRALPKEGETRFNVAWGTPLAEHPVFQTGVIPLRLGAAEDPATLLSSLLSSPQCNPRSHGLSPGAIRSALWPEDRALDAEAAVERLSGKGRRSKTVAESLSPFVKGGARPLTEWLILLRASWRAVGFHFLGESVSEVVRIEQANALEGLEASLRELERLAGARAMCPQEVLDWLVTASENRQVVTPGTESAGIQVLSLRDAFGLPFDRVWFVGCHGSVLPGPRPTEPLLAPEEVAALGGKAHEEAWAQAERDLSGARALCTDGGRSFSRAFTEEGDKQFLSSPFFEDDLGRPSSPGAGGKGDAGVPRLFDIWQDQRDTWTSAPWFRGTLEGLAAPLPVSAPDPVAVPEAVPEKLSVSKLRIYLWCSFRFFAEGPLHLKPLPRPPDGLAPKERGDFVHEILREFVESLAKGEAESWPEEDDGAWRLLKTTARRLAGEHLPDKLSEAERRAELRWLLGDDDAGRLGVLRAWLEAEQPHWQAGWRPAEAASAEDGSKCFVLERPFEGLTIPGSVIPLAGKVDRVDTHPTKGRWILDYKTGSLPATKRSVFKDFTEPQLPAYAAAVLQGCFGDTPPPECPEAITAGYVPLKNPAEVTVEPYASQGHPVDAALVETWRARIGERLAALSSGRFPAAPFPGPRRAKRGSAPCEHCEMAALCGFYDDPERARAERESGAGQDEGDPP